MYMLNVPLCNVTKNGEEVVSVQTQLGSENNVILFYNNKKCVKIDLDVASISQVGIMGETDILNYNELTQEEQSEFVTDKEKKILLNPITNPYVRLPMRVNKHHDRCNLL